MNCTGCGRSLDEKTRHWIDADDGLGERAVCADCEGDLMIQWPPLPHYLEKGLD